MSSNNKNIDDSKNGKIMLKVGEANTRDVGRKIARIDPKVAQRLVWQQATQLKFHQVELKQLF
jgi:hypothetical protein